MTRYLFTTMLALCTLLPAQSFASTIVAPAANTGTEGNDGTVAPFRFADFALQWSMAGSQFASMPIGSEITAIGFRLDGTVTTQPLADVTYGRWDLQLSRPVFASAAMSATYATNIGADVVTVRSGPLTIPANAFFDAPGLNPFYFITFDTPYVYQGGGLLATLRLTGSQNIRVDAVTTSSIPGIGNTLGNFDSNADATGGSVGFFTMPVTAFQFEAPGSGVPEPSTWSIMGAGLGLLMFGWKRRS
jgi:hypothetical protein